MLNLHLSELATLLHDELLSPLKVNPDIRLADIVIDGISIDTRVLQPKNLFVAIPGEYFDGHDFIEDAFKKGASAALISKPGDYNIPCLTVSDTTQTLGKLAAHWRMQFQIPLVAVTGSNGKTTTKNLIASILQAACDKPQAVVASHGSLNNHWGLPLTLLRLGKEHQYAVLEMGMNHFGEIDYLTKLAQPSVAVITNAGASHLAGVGDVAGVARAKGEIFNGLADNGIAILNRDDAHYDYWKNCIGNKKIITFGLHANADIYAKISHTPHGQMLTIFTPAGELQVNMGLLGKHNAQNALAAAAAATALNISHAAIKTGLEKCEAAPGRLQLRTLTSGLTLIDDTYNANPFSLLAAANTLAAFDGEKILVLGDMKELGEEEAAFHQLAGSDLRTIGINYLFTYGNLSRHTTESFGPGASHFDEQADLLQALTPFLNKNATILVKGSRSMKMEKVVQGLMTLSPQAAT